MTVSSKPRCRGPGCKRVMQRWYGWNAAKLGEPPELIKAPLCSFHARVLKRRIPGKVVPL